MIWLAGRGYDDTTIEAALRAYPHGQVCRLDTAGASRRIKDLLREAGKHRDRVARAREAAAWLDDLICGKDGPLDNVANVCIALAGDPCSATASGSTSCELARWPAPCPGGPARAGASGSMPTTSPWPSGCSFVGSMPSRPRAPLPCSTLPLHARSIRCATIWTGWHGMASRGSTTG